MATGQGRGYGTIRASSPSVPPRPDALHCATGCPTPGQFPVTCALLSSMALGLAFGPCRGGEGSSTGPTTIRLYTWLHLGGRTWFHGVGRIQLVPLGRIGVGGEHTHQRLSSDADHVTRVRNRSGTIYFCHRMDDQDNADARIGDI
jgi:hypothetical protein